MRVLVIEDHQELAGVLARGLRREGMAVDVALDGGEGWFKLGVSDYDVVVLDRDLPVLHGDELCRRLRAQGAGTRVLMLTAAGGPRRAAEGLGLGADDYLSRAPTASPRSQGHAGAGAASTPLSEPLMPPARARASCRSARRRPTATSRR
jgi:CheY-like chemotaxis protein